jgi:hypothetical protein
MTGASSATAKRLTRLISRIIAVKRVSVFCMDDALQVADVRPSIPVEIIPIEPSNVHRVADFRQETNHVAIFRRMLAEGERGVYALVDQKVAGHAWARLSTKEPFLYEGYLDVPPGHALVHYCNVKDTLRGKGIYPTMLTALCQCLFSECSVRMILIDSGTRNLASIRGILKAGFVHRADILCIRACGRRLNIHRGRTRTGS